MKRIISLVCVASLLLALTGCGEASPTEDDSHAARFISGDETQCLAARQLRGSPRILLAQFFPREDQFCAMGFDGKTVYCRGTDDCFLDCSGNRIDLSLAGGQKN